MMRKLNKISRIMLIVFMLLALISASALASGNSPENEYEQQYEIYIAELRRTIAQDFGLEVSDLAPLIEANMPEYEIVKYLETLYPYDSVNASSSDYINLSQETNMSLSDSAKSIELGYKWNKDPLWLSALFESVQNWNVIDKAFELRQETLNIQCVEDTNEYINLANEIASIYNVQPRSILVLLNSGATIEEIADLIFMSQIVFEEKNINLQEDERELFTLNIDEVLSQDWRTQVSQEMVELGKTWPEREFPEALLPLQVPQIVDGQYIYEDNSLVVAASLKGPEPFIKDHSKFFGANTTSPYNVFFEGIDERVDPKTGHLSAYQTDFSLPGKYGMNFSFTRVFSQDQNALEEPGLVPELKGYNHSAHSGSGGGFLHFHSANGYCNSLRSRTKGKGWIATCLYDYPLQFSDNGRVLAILYGEEIEVGINFPSFTPIIDSVPYEATYATMESRSKKKDPVYEYTLAKQNTERKNNIFGLGTGWKVAGIPIIYIIQETKEKFIELDEGMYKIEKDGSLKNRNLKDLEVLIDKSYTFNYSGNISKSEYVLINKNGEKWYFDEEGKPLAHINKFGAIERFIYYLGKVNLIIDSVGRNIHFYYDSLASSIVVRDQNGQELETWHYTYQTTNYGSNTKLITLTRPDGSIIRYEYVVSGSNYNETFNGQDYNFNLKYLNLSRVIYPTQATTEYSYSGNRISSRQDRVPTMRASQSSLTNTTIVENKYTYSYGTKNMTKTLATTGEGIKKTVEHIQFDGQNRIIKQSITSDFGGENRNQTEVIETIFEYTGNKKLPNRKTTTIKLGNQTKIVEDTKMIYDDYGNIVSSSDLKGIRTESKFDYNYNMLTQQTVYIDDQNGTRIDYHLDSTNKKVEKIEEYMVVQQGWMPTSDVWRQSSKLKNGSEYIWIIPLERTSNINFECKWSGGGFWRDSEFILYYRQQETNQWIEILHHNESDGLFAPLKSLNRTVSGLPEGRYEFKIKTISGNIQNIKITAEGYDKPWRAVSKVVSTTYEYDRNNPGNVITIKTYPLHNKGEALGAPESITSYSYDIYNALVTSTSINVTSIEGAIKENRTLVNYDGKGRIVSEKLLENNTEMSVISYNYDVLGRLTKVTNPPLVINGNTSEVKYFYDDNLRQITVEDELGNLSRTTYDGLGRPIYSEWKDDANLWHMASYSEYNPVGNIVKTLDANYKGIETEYDAFGRIIKTTLADEASVEYWYISATSTTPEPSISLVPPYGMYNSISNPLDLASWIKVKDAEGNESYIGYDIYGRKVWTATNKKDNPSYGTPRWDMSWLEYDKYGRIIKTAINRTDLDWDITEYEYNIGNSQTIFNSPLTMKLPGNVEPKYIYEYNSQGLKTKEYQEGYMDREIRYNYDELGRLKQVIYPTTNEFKFIGPDEASQVIPIIPTTLVSLDKSYDLNQYKEVQFYYNGYEGSIRFFAEGSVDLGIEKVTADIIIDDQIWERIIDLEFEDFNNNYPQRGDIFRKTKESLEIIMKIENYSSISTNSPGLDNPGSGDSDLDEEDMFDLEIILDPLPSLNSISFSVEINGVSQIIQSNVARKDEFYYNIFGIIRADEYKDNILDSSVSMGYNPRGWITQEKWTIDNEQYIFLYDYDVSGNKIKMIYPDNDEIRYNYDEIHRIKSIPGYFGTDEIAGFIYDDVGNIIQQRANNEINTTYTYDYLYRVTSISNSILSLNYNYTPNGYISSIVDSTNQIPVNYFYTYDSKGQLLTANVNTESGIKTVGYTYDGANNRISESRSDSSQIITYSYLPGNYLISRNGEDISYYEWDNRGQLSSKSNGKEYIFNGKNQLVSTLKDGEGVEVYTYDALGRRVKVVTSSESTINLPLGNDSAYEIKKEKVSENVSTTKYVSINGKYLAKAVKENEEQEQKYFYHVDLVGSIRAITDLQGNIVASYEYEPFGDITSVTGIDNDSLGFTGKRLDESELSYYGARYYDSEIGRFISRDPIFDGRNWFVYCNNNPLVYIDPNGLNAILINKPVDNIGNLLGIEHTSAFFQDENDKWWYFYWGDVVNYVEVENESIFGSMSKINQWLIDNNLLNPNYPYRDSVYIKGDFTDAHKEAQKLSSAYEKSLKNWNGKGLPNKNYNLLTNNCSQMTMRLFEMGTLPSGINVGNYINSRGFGISVIPNVNMSNMQMIFYNKAFNISGFEADIQTQLIKLTQGKNYPGLNSINAIK